MLSMSAPAGTNNRWAGCLIVLSLQTRNGLRGQGNFCCIDRATLFGLRQLAPIGLEGSAACCKASQAGVTMKAANLYFGDRRLPLSCRLLQVATAGAKRFLS
ncbi:hypothetical protein RRG08_027758 [Elysia crispata]|uniref:Uncharacterized protein n=1 Tax=Elysia crispata TaxID=231223 RepID=A0AAE0ZAZ0_9GAST|nr:hypothetical protein RRG08_027758 [Elysia crispata]